MLCPGGKREGREARRVILEEEEAFIMSLHPAPWDTIGGEGSGGERSWVRGGLMGLCCEWGRGGRAWGLGVGCCCLTVSLPHVPCGWYDRLRTPHPHHHLYLHHHPSHLSLPFGVCLP